MLRTFLVAAALLAELTDASAVSLNGRTDDDSVCDLSPYTTSRLGQKTFVPAGTQNIEEIYARLALRFVVSACRPNQILIMHSDDGSRFEDRYFTEVATRLCGAAKVLREPRPTAEEPHAFLVKCEITQLKSAELWLHNAEREQSTESLIATGAPHHDRSDDTDAGTLPEHQSKCKQGLTFGALMGISGGCRE